MSKNFYFVFHFFLSDFFIVIQASNKKVTSFLKSLNAINVNEMFSLGVQKCYWHLMGLTLNL